jgi:uncharacterized protein YcaQ
MREGRRVKDSAPLVISPEVARRLAIMKQRLAGPPPAATRSGMMDAIRALGCLQLDPTSAVAQSHLLVLWSRLGPYDRRTLERLRWTERRLFDYWAHAASIVLTEDYPIHAAGMRRWGKGDALWNRRVRAWIDANAPLRRHILSALRRRGPLASRDIEDRSTSSWVSTGWTRDRNVDRMLTFLWVQGKILVAGRNAQGRVWDLAERVLPPWAPRERLSDREVVIQAAQRSLRALGVARPRDIEQHFIRGRYPGLRNVLAVLESRGRIRRVAVDANGGAWPGVWFIHEDDVALVEGLRAGRWAPRTTLLSPFDNLICDRARTELMFDFRFRLEIYVPKAQRTYGFFVMPILHGDKLIGRVDPALDRRRGRLLINAVHTEPLAPGSRTVGPSGAASVRASVRSSVEDLARFLGAGAIDVGTDVPANWRRTLG